GDGGPRRLVAWRGRRYRDAALCGGRRSTYPVLPAVHDDRSRGARDSGICARVMSRAFTKEDAQQEDVVVVARAPLPEDALNLVTTRGYSLLRAEEKAI